jgi:hypothetical protein
MGNIALSNQALEQAAKEVGDFYVRRGRPDRTDSSRPAPVAVTSGVPSAPDYSLSAESSLATAI